MSMRERFEHDSDPVRLDLLLVERLGVTRGEARRAIEGGQVSVGGREVRKVSVVVERGEVVLVEGAVAAGDLRVEPEYDLVLRVVGEGEGWVCVNKLSGQAVHPLRAGETGTVLNAVAARWPEIHGVGEGGLRSGVVHRLDVTTSGALLVATTEDAWQRLRASFATRSVRKRYLVLVEGRCEGAGRWEMDLRVSTHRPARVSAVAVSGDPHPESRRCDLRWEALVAGTDATLLSVDLGTGFLHQIRAMASAQGHPVVGDEAYGAVMEAGRPMLHASVLEVEGRVLRAEVPGDFVVAAQGLGISVPR